jgi:hypothetical protein
MPSTFTWLDYSEHERRKMLDVVKLFGDRDTRDELGIGSIRDALADLLFPGTGTVQTRARYFLFVPWMYLELERKRTEPGRIADQARKQEILLIKSLMAAGENESVIGRLAQDRLQRLPSNIYWQGLGVLGIRFFRGSQDQYHRSLARHYAHLSELRRQRGEDFVDARVNSNWHPGIPQPPAGFPNGVNLSLSYREADYLRERIQTQAPRTLFAYWAGNRTPPPQSFFAWDLVDERHPVPLRQQLGHARSFSEAIHGASLLYNLLLAEQTTRADWVDRYRTALGEWIETLTARMPALLHWDENEFWSIVNRINPRVPAPARDFVKRWLALAIEPAQLPRLPDDASARDLIQKRERFLKKGQARLENRRALDLWNGSAGAAQLDFRWRIAQQHVQDIHDGLRSR